MDFVLDVFPAHPVGDLSVWCLRKHSDEFSVGHLTVGLVCQVGHEQRHAFYDAGDPATPHR